MAATQTSGETSFDLEQLRRVFRRRGRWFLIPAALGLIVGVAVALLLPPTYEAGTTVLIEAQGIPERLVETTVVADRRVVELHEWRRRPEPTATVPPWATRPSSSAPLGRSTDRFCDGASV